jgi:hypothetical protein
MMGMATIRLNIVERYTILTPTNVCILFL